MEYASTTTKLVNSMLVLDRSFDVQKPETTKTNIARNSAFINQNYPSYM